jgi:CBS domain-containing protein
MTVARILKGKVGKVITASPDDSILSVAGRLSRHHIGSLVVVDPAGAIAGIIAEGDVVRAVAGGQACDASVTARHIMRPCSVTCTADTSEAELLDMMSDNHIQHLPVMNNGRLAGIVSLGDVVRLRRQKIRDMLLELEALADDGRFTANLRRHRDRAPLTLARTG